MREVISRKEAEAQGLKWYFTGEPCIHGHLCERLVSNNRCKECAYAAAAVLRKTPKSRQWQKAYRDKQRIENPEKQSEYLRKWRTENAERFRELCDRWKIRNPEKHKESQARSGKKYRENNPEVFRLHARSRNTRLSQHTPNWVNREELRSVYAACPDDYEVDHVVPIKGRTVSGLHVPWNLQYLTPSENSAKGNRWSEWSPDGSDDSTLFHLERKSTNR